MREVKFLLGPAQVKVCDHRTDSDAIAIKSTDRGALEVIAETLTLEPTQILSGPKYNTIIVARERAAEVCGMVFGSYFDGSLAYIESDDDSEVY